MRTNALVLATGLIAVAALVAVAGLDPTPSEPPIRDREPTSAASSDHAQRPVTTDAPPAVAAWPDVPPGATPTLDAIHGSDRDRAVAGGAFMLHDTTLFSCLYTTHDGGASWTRVGPAIDGGRILAVRSDENRILAVGHHHEVDGGAPFVLASHDGGTHWQRQALDLGPYRGALITAATLVPTPAEPVMALELAGMPQRRLWLSWTDRIWRLEEADSGSAAGSATSVTPRGWSWRIFQGLIETRGPDEAAWRPTADQPLDEVEDPDDAGFTA